MMRITRFALQLFTCIGMWLCRQSGAFMIQQSSKVSMSSPLLVSTSPENDFPSRRRFVSFSLIASVTAVGIQPAQAEETIWRTGKAPKVPGQKPKDKSDVSGTRKDPKFLRSLSDCKNQCENSAAGPDGFAKTKEDCLSECQDICCTTYEQCTFAIVPRI